MITEVVGFVLTLVGLAARENTSIPELFRQRRRHLDLIKFLSVDATPQGTVLDCGCGDGGLLSQMQEIGWTDFHGCDWHCPEGIVQKSWLTFTKCDLNREALIAFPDCSYDLVVCSEVLEHVENPAWLLRELSRVMKPEATLYITIPNATNFFERVHFCMSGNSTRYNSERHSGPWSHISFFTSNILESLLDRAGLSIVNEGQSAIYWGGYFFFPSRNFSSRWSYSRLLRLKKVSSDINCRDKAETRQCK